jgi:hypothetical protein
MKQISEREVKAEASRGKNRSLAKETKVIRLQNAEVQPARGAIPKRMKRSS